MRAARERRERAEAAAVAATAEGGGEGEVRTRRGRGGGRGGGGKRAEASGAAREREGRTHSSVWQLCCAVACAESTHVLVACTVVRAHAQGRSVARYEAAACVPLYHLWCTA